MIKRIFSLLLCACVFTISFPMGTDTLFVHEPQVPILIERIDNVLCKLRIEKGRIDQLDEVTLHIGPAETLPYVEEVKIYYAGTEAAQLAGQTRYAPVDYLSSSNPGRTLEAFPCYSLLKDHANRLQQGTVRLDLRQKLFPGVNYFWVSIRLKPQTPLLTTVESEVAEAKADGQALPITLSRTQRLVRRVGVGVRHAGDEGVAAYRIPGLTTTNKGTLLAVYDVRYNSSVDLQEHVDVGLSRSTDGGESWERMRLPLAFGEAGGLPSAQNGVGDPSILVDTKTNTVWIVAAWTHGMGHGRAWFNSQQGMEPGQTAQLVMTKSTDDGRTWSAPINITRQVKDPSWYFLLQGPGRGITMQDGTLVFPIQYIDSTRVPNAGIMYSKDRGATWHIHQPARSNTTEAQVAEIEPGVLMLNMRDNRGGSRAVSVTSDLGRTWTEHSSSRKALIEPVCMASLIAVKAKDNVLGRDLLLFSNPNSGNKRNHITLKVSLDKGKTWLATNQLLLDEEDGWGYSCLTLIDRETVGILYESSVAHITFQAVRLKDLVRTLTPVRME